MMHFTIYNCNGQLTDFYSQKLPRCRLYTISTGFDYWASCKLKVWHYNNILVLSCSLMWDMISMLNDNMHCLLVQVVQHYTITVQGLYCMCFMLLHEVTCIRHCSDKFIDPKAYGYSTQVLQGSLLMMQQICCHVSTYHSNSSS